MNVCNAFTFILSRALCMLNWIRPTEGDDFGTLLPLF
jgi:hypothetical protein